MNKSNLWVLFGGAIVVGILIMIFQPKYKGSEHQINYVQIKVFDPVYIALDQGYFKEAGVTVNLKGETFGGPQALTAAASGDVDAGIAATTAIINARAAGIKVKGILDVQTSFKDSPLMKWYALNESKINSASNLRGKKIGVNALGASFYYGTFEYLMKNNIPTNEVEFLVIPHGNLEQALRSRQIDVAGMIDPFSEIAYERGGLHTLFTAYDVLGENQFSMIFMSEKKIQSDPIAVVKFTESYKKAVKFIEDNPEKAADIIAKIFDIDKKYIPKHQFIPNARVNIDDIRSWLMFMKSQGVKELDSIKPEDVGTNEFNN